MKCLKKIFHIVVFLLVAGGAQSSDWEYRGSAEFEARYFFDAPSYIAQDDSQRSASIVLTPEASYEFENDHRFLFKGLFRYDETDDNRTHNDIRELNYLHVTEDIETTLGMSYIYWGVTESRHLVDIINQTDFVENLSGEEKLGQPMLNVKSIQDWGTVSAFVLFGFREREFSAVNARLSGPFKVATDNSVFESDKADEHIDYAVRWSSTYDDWDVGVSAFQGTSREPRLVVGVIDTETVLLPYYDQIKQLGLDLQYTGENTLWKLESIVRSGNDDDFFAAVGGFEYTFYGIFDSVIDVGVIAEYLYDDRDELLSPATNLDDDIAIGVRMAFNDTQDSQLLLVAVVDNKSQTTFINLEAERRISNSWKLSIEGSFFTNVETNDPLFFIHNDDHITASLGFYF